MSYSNALHRWIGVSVFLLTLGTYIKTMAPAVSFWDCGEFIATSYILGVPHPPGSPLYVLLGRLFSMVPLSDVAVRITFMSALSSALAVWCVYLSTLALGRRALGGHSLKPFGDHRDIGLIAGAVVAALSLAFSYTQWFNATEAEVYGYSIFFTCFGLWLILYWEGTGHGSQNDRWLLFIAYLFGLGGGLHLLCLLTIPALAILAWFADQQLRRLMLQLAAFAVLAGLAMALLGSGLAPKLLIVAGLGGLIYYLYDRDRRACYLLLGVVLLFALGDSTYTALYIRSGLNPAIDENDPETWKAFLSFINREQYGSESMLLSMLTPRAERAYQFWDQQMKYFFQQFPFPLFERAVMFRKATGNTPHEVAVSLLPYALGLIGLLWQAKRDWRRFAAVLSIFVIMGFGLSFYLNMPDPQPRERHYVFGGMYLAFALWIGLGWTAIIEALRQHLVRVHALVLVGVALFGLLLPAGIFAKLYHIEDRSGDYIAHDYAHNLLQSCDPNSILFTNGDNDTFPLWYLQEVEEVRTDVRVVNLSLLNTNWYIKQLRDREPKIDIRYDDQFIDSVLTDTQEVDIYRRYWGEPKTLSVNGLEWEMRDYSGYNVLRVQDVMVLKTIEWNEWEKPIHFALTVPTSNRIGIDNYLTLTGMTLTLNKLQGQSIDQERTEDLLFNIFKLRSILDPNVYKDENTARLLGNYRAIFAFLSEHYESTGQAEPMKHLMQWSEENIQLNWHTVYLSAQRFYALSRPALAASYMEKAANAMLVAYENDANASYENLVTMGDIVHDRYEDAERAERIYLSGIAFAPKEPDAYYGLAATRQAQGDEHGALALVEEYMANYGETEQMVQARQILQNALGINSTPEEPAPIPQTP
jgi:hypothetical protein